MVDIHLVKLVANVVVTASTSKVVRQVIQANTNPQSTFEDVQMFIGSFAIGGLVAERAWERTEVQIDKAVGMYERWRETQ